MVMSTAGGRGTASGKAHAACGFFVVTATKKGACIQKRVSREVHLGERVGEGAQDLVGGNLRLTGNVRSRCRFFVKRWKIQTLRVMRDNGAGSGMMADAGFSRTNRC